MSVFLSHSTAEHVLLHRNGARFVDAPNNVLPLRSVHKADLERFDGSSFGIENKPIEYLVSSRCFRRTISESSCHVHLGAFPSKSFLQIADGVYCSTPEYLLVQRACELSFTRLVELAINLCGSYSLTAEGTIVECAPITSPTKISRFLDQVPGAHGVGPVRSALRFVLSGSASPWETKMCVCNVLPPMRGGYGFANIELNHVAKLGKHAKSRTYRRAYSCDEYFPDCRLDLEYQSNEFHGNEHARRDDELRRKTLESMGIRVIAVHPYELRNIGLYDNIAREIARCQGKKLRVFDDRHFRARVQMRRELFPGYDEYGRMI